MITDAGRLDTLELEQRAKAMYDEVALPPQQELPTALCPTESEVSL